MLALEHTNQRMQLMNRTGTYERRRVRKCCAPVSTHTHTRDTAAAAPPHARRQLAFGWVKLSAPITFPLQPGSVPVQQAVIARG